MTLANATRSEITKQFTTVGWWVIGVILAVYLVLQVGAISATFSWSADQNGITTLDEDMTGLMYSLAGSSGYIFPLLFGTLMVTTEFRHKLIVPTFLATPRRGAALAAKLGAGVVMGAFFAAVAVVVTVAVVVIITTSFGFDSAIGQMHTWQVLGRSFVALVLWALIGIGVGSVIRNQVAAIVTVLAFTMLIEPILRVVASLVDWLPAVTKWLPGSATEALVGYNALMGSGMETELLPWWGGALVLVGYAVLFSVIGSLTTWRRDIS